MHRYENYGPTLLRIALGVMFIAHSAYLKIFVFTIPGTVGFFESIGLPGILAYLVITAEISGGVMLILGVRVREVALVLTIILLGATWTHLGNGWLFTNEGGGWEYPLFLAVACVVQMLLGPGAIKLEHTETSDALSAPAVTPVVAPASASTPVSTTAENAQSV